MTNKWEDNFRPDGTRGHCPKCNKMFDMRSNESFKTGLLRHYEEFHKDKLFEAIDYADKLFNKDRYVGFNFIKRSKEGKVIKEIWVDSGDNKDEHPKNHWKLLLEKGEALSNESVRIDNIPSDHQETFGGCSNISAALKAFDDRLDADRKYALENGIMCEHPGCKWGADHRCSECLSKGIDRWFCRPFNFIQHYYGPYAFSFEKGKEWIHYDNRHVDAHSDKEHPKHGMVIWKEVKEVKDNER